MGPSLSPGALEYSLKQDLSANALSGGAVPTREKEPHDRLDSVAKVKSRTQQMARSPDIHTAARMGGIL